MILTFCMALLVGPQAGTTLFVSPTGNDAWTGSLDQPNAAKSDGPLATLDGARLRVRAIRATASGPITVQFRKGRYPVSKAVTFDPADSGSANAPITYESYPGERAVISGGKRVIGWAQQNGSWSATLPQVADGKWRFSQLYIDDVRRDRSRLPKAGVYKIPQDEAPSAKNQEKGNDRLAFEGDAINPAWAQNSDVEVVAFHNWEISRNLVDSVDTSAKVVTFQAPTRGLAKQVQFRQGGKFYVENAKEGFTEPGQWYLDRTSGLLEVHPNSGEDLSKETVIAPVAREIIVLNGSDTDDNGVQYVNFRNLDIQESGWNLTQKGRSMGQGEVDLSGAITMSNASNIEVTGCKIARTGSYAISLTKRCSKVLVDSNTMLDLGAGGVKVGPFTKGKDPGPDACRDITIRENAIVSGGRTHPSSCGVILGQVANTQVDHNTIRDFVYSGISAGYTWGYEPSGSHDVVISNNDISEIGEGLLSDLGGIYTLGASPNSKITHNRIRGVTIAEYGGWGIYLDEGSSNFTIEQNLVSQTVHGGLHIHFGRDNVVRNNVFAFGDLLQLQLGKKQAEKAADFERNIVVFDKGDVFSKFWISPGIASHDNLYWGYGSASSTCEQALRTSKQGGLDNGSVVGDPKFRDPQGGDFTLESGSAAKGIGFQPITGTFGTQLPIPSPARNPWPSLK